MTLQFIHQNLKQTKRDFKKTPKFPERFLNEKCRQKKSCGDEGMCPVKKLGTFSGKLVSGVVLTAKIELILTVAFRIQAKTSHFLRKSCTSFHSCVKKLGMSWCLRFKGAQDREEAWQCCEFWETGAPGRCFPEVPG